MACERVHLGRELELGDLPTDVICVEELELAYKVPSVYLVSLGKEKERTREEPYYRIVVRSAPTIAI